MRADTEAEFSVLTIYALYDKLYWGVSTEHLSYRVWHHIISVDDIDLHTFGTVEVKRTWHVAAVDKGVQTFTGRPLIDEYDEVDMWRYRVYR